MFQKILTAASYPAWPGVDYVLLEVVPLDDAGNQLDEPSPYVLYKDDPYGTAPALRQQLQEKVDAGEIVIENGNPEGWPWWVPPPEQPIEEDPSP